MRTAPLLVVMALATLLSSCSNPSTPAGYVDVVKQPIAIGQDAFIATQDGPTSTGLGWRLRVLNVSVPEKIVRVAYDNYIKQAIRTFARAEVQKYDGLQIKNNIDTIDTAIAARMNSMLASTPFEIIAALVSDTRSRLGRNPYQGPALVQNGFETAA